MCLGEVVCNLGVEMQMTRSHAVAQHETTTLGMHKTPPQRIVLQSLVAVLDTRVKE